MSRFKVGDTVRIRTDLKRGVYYGDLELHFGMSSLCGNIGEITRVYGGRYYEITTGGAYSWSEEMLEPVFEDNVDNFDFAILDFFAREEL